MVQEMVVCGGKGLAVNEMQKGEHGIR